MSAADCDVGGVDVLFKHTAATTASLIAWVETKYFLKRLQMLKGARPHEVRLLGCLLKYLKVAEEWLWTARGD